jgi:hypothetical protein
MTTFGCSSTPRLMPMAAAIGQKPTFTALKTSSTKFYKPHTGRTGAACLKRDGLHKARCGSFLVSEPTRNTFCTCTRALCFRRVLKSPKYIGHPTRIVLPLRCRNLRREEPCKASRTFSKRIRQPPASFNRCFGDVPEYFRTIYRPAMPRSLYPAHLHFNKALGNPPQK